MKSKLFRTFTVLFLVFVMLFSLPVAAEETSQSDLTNPYRAVWVRPKETTKEAVEAKVQSIADAGLNTIFLETIYDGYSIYPIEHECVEQNAIYGGFDVLQAYIDACHARNMQLHCWVESFFVGMEWSNNGGPIVAAHPDWLLQDDKGNNFESTMYGKMYFLNPVRPECRDFLVDLFTNLVTEYEVDGFQMDYVRYPEINDTVDWGFDAYTLQAFEDARGMNPVGAAKDSNVYKAFLNFRSDAVTAYVKACSESVRKARPGITVSLSVAPNFDFGEQNHCQSARKWMSSGYADLLVPMSYYEDQIVDQTNATLTAVGKDASKVIMGISTQSGFTKESVCNQVKAVLDQNCGISFFEYESLFSEGYTEELKKDLLSTFIPLEKNKAPSETGSEAGSEKGSVDASDLNEVPNPIGGWVTYAVIVAGVLLVVVLLVVFLKKKPAKKDETSENAE